MLVPLGSTSAQSTDPAVVGQWSATFSLPIIPIHTSLLPSGQVLIYDSATDASTHPRVFDPATLTTTAVPFNDTANLFCSGHAPMTDGRILALGGHTGAYSGINAATIFDGSTSTWLSISPMTYSRWYPTVTKLPDGRMLVVSGAIDCSDCADPNGTHLGIAAIPEIYDPRNGSWTSLNSASLRLPLYPHMYVLPDGRLFAATTQEDPIVSQVLDLSTATWSAVDSPRKVEGGSSAMYRPGKIVKSGTARNPDYPAANAVANTYVIDMNVASPAWRQTASMAYPRTQHNLVLLPDGKVLAVGGGRNSDVNDLANAVFQAEIWNPSTETWSTMAASGGVPRLYHSVALLLPDGRVLSAGGGHPPGFGVPQFAAEIYSPPYLFKGSRPSITSAPGVVEYGQDFLVETPAPGSIVAVNLIAQGSVTHGFNMNARFLTLPFSQAAGGLQVTAPANVNLAPPGLYMMFLVDANGVPSVASWIRFPAAWEDVQAPSAPSSLAANASPGLVDLSWLAAGDNVGVTAYDVYRSTVSGFAPSGGNRVGQSATTSYRDSGFDTGTYYYVVRARDAVGNTSLPSNEAMANATADTTAPSAPSSLSLVRPGAGSLGLAWSASTDNVGVAAYLLERCTGVSCATFAQVASTAPNAWTDVGLTASTSYRYRVRAQDSRGNLSGYSNILSAATSATSGGLVGAWSFNERAGTTANDVSGLANQGSIGGAIWTPDGRFGAGLSFDGIAALVTVADSASLDLTSGMTLEAWAQPQAPMTGWSTILHKNVDRYYLFANSSSEVPATGGTFGNGNQNTYGTAALQPGDWVHLAATLDGARVRLYVNGTEVGSTAQTSPLTTSTGTLQMGGSGYGENFQGAIDEVRVYNRPLTPAEIQADMATPVLDGVLSVRAKRVGGSIVLDWVDSASNGTYRVRRALGPTAADFASAACWVVNATTFTDPAPANDGVSYDYLVDVKRTCP